MVKPTMYNYATDETHLKCICDSLFEISIETGTAQRKYVFVYVLEYMCVCLLRSVGHQNEYEWMDSVEFCHMKYEKLIKTPKWHNLKCTVDEVMSIFYSNFLFDELHYLFTAENTVREILAFVQMVKKQFSYVCVHRSTICFKYFSTIYGRSNFSNIDWCLWYTQFSYLLQAT